MPYSNQVVYRDLNKSFHFRHCGAGVKERRVECKQIMAQEHKVERRPELCPSIKPQEKKPCNTKPCAPEDQRPPIASSNSTYIQHDPKKNKVKNQKTMRIFEINSIFITYKGNAKNWWCSDSFLWHPS